MALKLAIYGYDTDIGKLVFETLEEQAIKVDELYPLSPLSGEYDAVTLDHQNYFVSPIEEFDFSKANVALFLSTQDESQRWINVAREKVIPALAPSVQLCLALSALHDEFGVAKATVTSLESVSELGRLGTETLAHETTLLLNGMAAEHQGFPAQLAFNLHTRMGVLEENGYSDHENAISNEVQRILGDFERGFEITCIQVPVFYGHTMVVNVDLEDQATVDEVEKAFEKSQYVALAPKDDVLSPVADIINERQVLVTRLRKEKQGVKSFSFVIMMDNTRRGEAISCVEIAKLVSNNI